MVFIAVKIALKLINIVLCSIIFEMKRYVTIECHCAKGSQVLSVIRESSFLVLRELQINILYTKLQEGFPFVL